MDDSIMQYTGSVIVSVLLSLSVISAVVVPYNAMAIPASNSLDIYLETIPSQVIVGDTIMIRAVIVNNTDTTITYRGQCESSISAEFDAHVSVEHVPACLGFSIHELKPGEAREVRGPASGIVYRAASSGVVRATVTFTYFIDDRMERVSEELIFRIADGISVTTDEQFRLHIGDSARALQVHSDGIDSIMIRLVDILEDSRCPINVYCIRAGSVTAMFEVSSVYGSMYLDLAVGDRGNDSTRVMGYTLTMLDVNPYPVAGEQIKKDDYTATLLVSRKIPVEHAAVRAYGDDGSKVITVWNELSGKGFMLSESKIIGFRVEQRECSDSYDICFNAVEGDDVIAVSIDHDDIMRMSVDGKEFTVKRMMMLFDGVRVEHTMAVLGIGAGDGTVTVIDIGKDGVDGSEYVTIMNYYRYPAESSRIVQLRHGDRVSDGCAVTFMLIGLGVLPPAGQIPGGGGEEPEAMLLREVVNRGRCPMYSI